MPVHKIQVLEYECALCGYKWVNRKNGKDQPKPFRCAKCKRVNWEEGNLSSSEKYYRRILMEECSEFFHHSYYVKDDDPDREHKMLGWNFLYWISPRPTVEELKKVLSPPIDYVKELGLEEFIDDKTNEKKHLIREGDQTYKDFSEVRLKIKELIKQKRPVIMQGIIDSRKEGSK